MGSYLEVLLEEMVRPGTGVTPVFKVGLIVNPIAGMGGRVSLKGTDGWHIVEEAVRLGARPHAPSRAIEALKRLGALREELEFITYPGDMGENEARACGFAPRVLGRVDLERTLASDTRRAAARGREERSSRSTGTFSRRASLEGRTSQGTSLIWGRARCTR